MRNHRFVSGTLPLSALIAVGFALGGIFATQSHAVDAPASDESRPVAFAGSEPLAKTSDFSLEKVFIPGVRQHAPERIFPMITAATLSGQPVIEFQVADELGLPVVGLRQGENVSISFTVNKLASGRKGETSRWRTYIRGADEGVADAQATTYSGGTLQDLGDGSYRFTFDKKLQSISNVAFRPALTHRVGMEIRDLVILGEEIPGNDAVFDIQPSTGNTSGIEQRKIVKQESCAACHGTEEFAFHGGPRQDVDYCVTCHQPGSRDVGSGNTMDFRIMIHKIHAAEQLTILPYEFCGFGCENFGAPPVDFSHVAFPQDVRNCTTCHDPNDPETPQAVNVNNRATAAVCTSCHDDLASTYNRLTNANGNHPALAQPNERCVDCHSEGGLIGSILDSHKIDSKVAASRIKYNILKIANTGEGQSPVVTFSITDPTNGDAPYDLVKDPEFTGSSTSVNMDIAWPTSDYTNVSNSSGTAVTGSPPSRPVSVSLVNSSGSLPTGVTDNGDGTYTVDTGLLATPVVVPKTTPGLGSGAVVIEGHPAGDFDGDGTYDDSVPVTTAVAYFPINDSRAQPRRQVVDSAKCQNCHGQNDGLAFHGSNRNDNTQACVVCHNPNQTDLRMRPVDPDGTLNGMNMAAADGLEDRTIDFKYMIHAIHGSSKRENPYVAYGFGVSSHDFSEVGFPRSPRECLACHRDGTYELPLGSNVLATTLSSNATVIAGSRFGASEFAPDFFAAEDPTDDNNASATGAVCSACHDSSFAMDHMSVRSTSNIAFGNAFLMNPDPVSDPDTQERINASSPENCAFCHGPGGIADIAVEHGIKR